MLRLSPWKAQRFHCDWRNRDRERLKPKLIFERIHYLGIMNTDETAKTNNERKWHLNSSRGLLVRPIEEEEKRDSLC